jgi:hypothetical protein
MIHFPAPRGHLRRGLYLMMCINGGHVALPGIRPRQIPAGLQAIAGLLPAGCDTRDLADPARITAAAACPQSV